MSSLNKGQRIADRYVLLSRLGDSQHAQIWLSQDRETLAQVVLKIARLEQDAALARRLIGNEFDVGKRLNHPSIVRYYDHHDDQALCFLTQEYVPDGDLSAFKNKPWRQFLPSVAELCDALAHIHAQGYVHRDVKLRNALLAGDGRLKLADFGIASVAGSGGLRSGGSPQSASPEQLAGADPAPSDDVYALGVLLRSLIGEKPADDVPYALRQRVAQMLSPSAANRPADLALVARELEDLVDQDPNATVPPDELDLASNAAEALLTIEPADVELGARAEAAPAVVAGARRGVSRAVGFVAILTLVSTAIAAVFLLPRLVPETITTSVGRSADPPGGATAVSNAEVAVEPWRLAQIARTRQLAEETLEQLLENQFLLEDKKVEIWANDEYELAKYAAIAGDRSFRDKDYDASLASYQDGHQRLVELLDRSENLVSENMTSGERNIEAGNSEAAIANFELLLKLEPKNAAANRGLTRATKLPEVIALVATAREHEQLGDYQAAISSYRAASAIDANWSAATDGVGRMNRKLAGSRFSAAMSQGFEAMAADQFDAASAAFARARKIRPNAQEIDEALAQLQLRQRSTEATSLRARAQTLEGQDDFRAAREQYRAALALEPNLSFALEGEQRMSERIELEDRLAAHVNNPDHLSNDGAYEKARRALVDARAVTAPWSKLSQQMATLEQLMSNSRITTRVRLVSDSETDVLVYRVGRLGRFESTDLELRPGTYTAVGSRAGYRDVRREFRIEARVQPPVVDVRCVDRI